MTRIKAKVLFRFKSTNESIKAKNPQHLAVNRYSTVRISVERIKDVLLVCRFLMKATRKSSLNDGIKEVAEIKETMKSAREGVKSSLRQETRAARLLFGTSSKLFSPVTERDDLRTVR